MLLSNHEVASPPAAPPAAPLAPPGPLGRLAPEAPPLPAGPPPLGLFKTLVVVGAPCA